MYAVVNTGGKQAKVAPGEVIAVEKLAAEVGDTVTLTAIMIADGDTILATPADLAGAGVTVEVLEHFKGDKDIVFKFKKRKGYKRTRGHRQSLTSVRVVEILSSGVTKPAKAKTEAKPVKPAAKAAPAKPKAEAKPAKSEKPSAESAPEAAAVKAEKPAAAPKSAAKPKAEPVAKAEAAPAKAAKPAAKAPAKAEAKPKAEKAPAKAAAATGPGQCEAVKSDGSRCTNKAKEGSKYCGVHAKLEGQ